MEGVLGGRGEARCQLWERGHIRRPLVFLFLSQLTAYSFKVKWIMLAISDGLHAAATGGGLPMCQALCGGLDTHHLLQCNDFPLRLAIDLAPLASPL